MMYKSVVCNRVERLKVKDHLCYDYIFLQESFLRYCLLEFNAMLFLCQVLMFWRKRFTRIDVYSMSYLLS